MLKKIVLSLFPTSTRRGKVVKKVAVRLGYARSFAYDEHYQVWLENAEEKTFLHPIEHKPTKNKPLFSVVVPMYNTQDKYLYPLVDSIVNQSFQDWELILGDGSTIAERKQAIEAVASQDERVKYYPLKKNEGISGNTNQAIKKAKGTYIVFTDHDDTLSPHALNEFAAAILDNPKTDILYSDEDKLTDNGKDRHWPHLKPNWSPHQFLTCNYTNHLSAIRRELVNKVGGLRTEYNGAQDYDLLLRVHGLPGKRNVYHVPKVLYHWREADGSTASDFTVKEYAIKAGEKALTEFLTAKGLEVTVRPIPQRPGFYDPHIAHDKKTQVLVIVGKQNDERASQTLKETLQSITSHTSFAKGKVVFVTETEYLRNTDQHTKKLRDTDVIVRIQDTVIPNSEDWLDRLTGVLELDDIYAVAPRMIGYDGRIWDMGLVDTIHGTRKPLFKGLQRVDDSIYGHTEWIRDVDSLTGVFYAIRARDFTLKSKEVTSAAPDRYVTVWSPVEATFYSKLGKVNGQYNENIEIGSDGSKTVLWQ